MPAQLAVEVLQTILWDCAASTESWQWDPCAQADLGRDPSAEWFWIFRNHSEWFIMIIQLNWIQLRFTVWWSNISDVKFIRSIIMMIENPNDSLTLIVNLINSNDLNFTNLIKWLRFFKAILKHSWSYPLIQIKAYEIWCGFELRCASFREFLVEVLEPSSIMIII